MIDELPGSDSNGTREEKRASISECGVYRYELTRSWDDDLPLAVWVMLNPSTADHEVDDPTIRRVRGFTKREGYGGLAVVNLYAYRSAKPVELTGADDPVGRSNDSYLIDWIALKTNVAQVIVAWGAFTDSVPSAHERVRRIEAIARSADRKLYCLGTARRGAPLHPLYLRSDAELVPWARR